MQKIGKKLDKKIGKMISKKSAIALAVSMILSCSGCEKKAAIIEGNTNTKAAVSSTDTPILFCHYITLLLMPFLYKNFSITLCSTTLFPSSVIACLGHLFIQR